MGDARIAWRRPHCDSGDFVLQRGLQTLATNDYSGAVLHKHPRRNEPHERTAKESELYR